MVHSSEKSNSGDITDVRIVVIGDRRTGKSSLIDAAANKAFPQEVPRVLPITRLPADSNPDQIPLTIVDTSASVHKLAQELKLADAVVLTYARDKHVNLDRLSKFWLLPLRNQEIKVPVILVGCKLDAREEDTQISLEQTMSPVRQQFPEIETCIECSARDLIQVPEVFYYAQKAVIYPSAPLFDRETQTMKPRCVRALKRIFILCDHDKDGALSDAELNDFQVKCFNAPLQPSDIAGVKRAVQEKLAEGVNANGLTLDGFISLHALYIEKGSFETTWTVLRKFGYNNDLKLRDDLIPVSLERAFDQSVELTNEAVEYLKGIFYSFDLNRDGALNPSEIDDLFSTAPENPWDEAPYRDAAEKTGALGLSLNGFLSEWSLMTLLQPSKSLAYLIYVNYPGDPTSALRITRRRGVDRKKRQSERNVFHCFVVGPEKAGKSALLSSLLGRPFSERYTPTVIEQFAANVVDGNKTLILHELSEDGVKSLLSSGKEFFGVCDAVIFVHDISDEFSWRRATEMLFDVANRVEGSGFEVPCLVVAAKCDLDPYRLAEQDLAMVSEDMGIEAAIHLSSKSENADHVFRKIISAAERPHLSIPETEAGRTRRQLVNSFLMFGSVGTAVAFLGVAAFRWYECCWGREW